MKRTAITLHAALVGLLAGAFALAPVRVSAAARPQPRTLEVYAAASLSDAFNDIGRMLEKRQPGLKVRFNFAGSQLLATQIEQGAVTDVFASADERWMGYVRERGLVPDGATVFAHNQLVVIVPRTNPGRIRRLQDLSRDGLKLVLGADAVPVGHYSRTLLQNLARETGFGGDFYTRVLHNVVSEEENVKSVVGKVQLGEADGGIVYRSDITPGVARFVHMLAVPDSANVLASYPMAIVRGSGEPQAARAFIDLVLSPEGQQVLARNGLIPVTAAKP